MDGCVSMFASVYGYMCVLRVCVYACVHVCTCECMIMRALVGVFVYMCTYVLVCLCTCVWGTCICMRVYVCVCSRVYMRVCTHVCMVCMYVFMYVCVPRGIILSTLQIINRSIDQLEMMFTEYVWGFNHI